MQLKPINILIIPTAVWLVLCLFAIPSFGQNEIFEARPGYDKSFGIQPVDTLNSGLVIFKKAQPEEVLELVSADDETEHSTDISTYFSWQFNFGFSKAKLLLKEWVYSVDLISENYLLTGSGEYKLYNPQGIIVKNLSTMKKPMLFHDILVVEVNGMDFPPVSYSWSYLEKLNLYRFFDLSGKIAIIYEDSLTDVSKHNDFLFLQNKHEPQRNKLMNAKMESVFPAGIIPVLPFADYALVMDSATSNFGIMNFENKVEIPLDFEKIDMGMFFNLFIEAEKIELNQDWLYLARRKSFITAIRNDSAFLYNYHFDLVFSGTDFQYDIRESSNGLIYLRIEQDNREGLIDSTGKVIVPIHYASVQLEQDYILVRSSDYTEEDIYSFEGEKLFSGPYHNIYKLSNGLVVLSTKQKADKGYDRKVWLGDAKTNTKLTPEPYEHYQGFSEGIIQFKTGRIFYFYNLKGELLFSLKADSIGDFEEGVAVVNLGKKKGKINRKGEWVEELRRGK